MTLVAIVSVPLLSLFTPAQAQAAGKTTATLLEAVEYSACDYHCAPFNHPTTAYCLTLGDETVVAERGSILGETQAKSMRSSVGSSVAIRVDKDLVWLADASHSELKLKRGSQYEHFSDTRCIAEVHKPVLEVAQRFAHPRTVPPDAFPLAAVGVTNPRFRWFACSITSVDSDITCKKWDARGVSDGVDRYCARTTKGDLVGTTFKVDPLLSREGQIILTFGAILERDERGRINESLMRPEEPCYQLDRKPQK